MSEQKPYLGIGDRWRRRERDGRKWTEEEWQRSFRADRGEVCVGCGFELKPDESVFSIRSELPRKQLPGVLIWYPAIMPVCLSCGELQGWTRHMHGRLWLRQADALCFEQKIIGALHPQAPLLLLHHLPRALLQAPCPRGCGQSPSPPVRDLLNRIRPETKRRRDLLAGLSAMGVSQAQRCGSVTAERQFQADIAAEP
jgi:hypothetical protein